MTASKTDPAMDAASAAMSQFLNGLIAGNQQGSVDTEKLLSELIEALQAGVGEIRASELAGPVVDAVRVHQAHQAHVCINPLDDPARPFIAINLARAWRGLFDEVVDRLWPLLDPPSDLQTARGRLAELQAQQQNVAGELAAAVAAADISAFNRLRPRHDLTLPAEVAIASMEVLAAQERQARAEHAKALTRVTLRDAAVTTASAAADKAERQAFEARTARDVAAVEAHSALELANQLEQQVETLVEEQVKAASTRAAADRDRFERLTGITTTPQAASEPEATVDPLPSSSVERWTGPWPSTRPEPTREPVEVRHLMTVRS